MDDREGQCVRRASVAPQMRGALLRAHNSVAETRALIGRHWTPTTPHTAFDLDGITADQAYYTPLPQPNWQRPHVSTRIIYPHNRDHLSRRLTIARLWLKAKFELGSCEALARPGHSRCAPHLL